MTGPIPSGARPIPGTDYQIANNQIYRSDGQTVSREEAARETSGRTLSTDALTILEDAYGHDWKPVGQSGPQQAATTSLLRTLSGADGSGNGAAPAFTMASVLVTLHEAGLEQRETASRVRDAQFANQIDALNDAVAHMKQAATIRMAVAVTVGVVTMGSGAVNIAGGVQGLKAGDPTTADATMRKWGGGAGMVDGAGKIIGALGEFFASGEDQQAKKADIRAKTYEQGAAAGRDMVDQAQQTMNKVLETLREIQQAEAQIGRDAASL